MQAPALIFSDDQAEAYDRLAAAFAGAGIDLAEAEQFLLLSLSLCQRNRFGVFFNAQGN